MSSSLTQTFDNVAKTIGSVNTFAEARQRARELFARAFFEANDSARASFASDLFRWSQDRLHLRNIDDRLAALAGFAFFIDIDDDQSQLLVIAQNLERILPLESIKLIDGISHLIKRIARNNYTSIVPHLFERCFSWLTTRATKSAVLSSVFLILRLSSYDYTIYRKISSDLNTIITTALKFESEEIQKAAVELCIKHTRFDPNISEYIGSYITSFVYLIQSEDQTPIYQINGAFLMVTAFVVNNTNTCRDRASDIFTSLLNYFKLHLNVDFLPHLVLLCEHLTAESVNFKEDIISIFRRDEISFKNPEITKLYSRLIKVMPIEFSEFGKNVMMELLPECSNSFFALAYAILQSFPNVLDTNLLLNAFETNELTNLSLEACMSFCKAFPQYVFRIIHIFSPKLTTNPAVALSFLHKFSYIPIFPIQNYWTFAFSHFQKSPEEIRLASIPAILAIVHITPPEEQLRMFFGILYSAQNDESAQVRKKFIESIDDFFLPILTDHSIFFMIEHFYDDKSLEVQKATINLIYRLRVFNPLSTLNFFYSRLSHYSRSYFQFPQKYDRMNFMKNFPLLIQASGQFIIPHQQALLNFLIGILDEKVETSSSILNRVSERNDQRFNRRTRIMALHSISELIKIPNDKIDSIKPHLIQSVIHQLNIFKHSAIHISAAKTLRSIARHVKFLNIFSSKELLRLHLNLFQFVRTSTNAEVNEAMMKLFGTIGSLNHHEFHTPQSHGRTNESYFLYDRNRREQSYLYFVMNYILGQLKNGSKTHDISVLINAIVYIFQSDATNCVVFLEDVVNIFRNMLEKTESMITADELFHFFRTIILVVDIAIMPHAETIMNMIMPFMKPKANLLALKLLTALIFAMKSNFNEYGPPTYMLILELLKQEDGADFENEVFLLLALTLLVLYADGSPTIYFETIQKRVLKRDMISEYALTFLCQVLRCCSYTQLVLPSLKLAFSILDDQARLREIALQLLYLLVLRFPTNVISLPIDLNTIDEQLNMIITKINQNEYIESAFDFLQHFNPVPDPFPIRSKPPINASPLSQIFGRGRLQSSVSENDWPAWLLQISQELVLCSNSPAIRASHPLLRVASDFERDLFPFVVVSVWDIALDADRKQLANYFLGIVHNSQTPQDILTIIVSACDSMDRANYQLFGDPYITGQIAERCNSWFTALRFYEKALSNSVEPISHLLRIHSILKRKESALGLLNIALSPDTNCTLLEALSMWSNARDIYQKKYLESNHNDNFLEGYLSCSALLEDWDVFLNKAAEFKTYTKNFQNKVAVFFAAAVRSAGDDPRPYLNSIRTDDPLSCICYSLNALDRNDVGSSRYWAQRGMTLLCTEMTPFMSGSYEPAIPTICTAMMFEELTDVADELEGKISSDEILKIWDAKASYVKRDATQLRNIFRVRDMLRCSKEENLIIKLDYLDSLRRTQDWTLFDNVFNHILANVDDERVNIMRAKFRFDRGYSKDLSEFEKIINRLEQGDIFCDAVCAYVGRSPNSPKIIPILQKVIDLQPTRVRAWKYWAYVNLSCAQNDEKGATYASDAMNGFANLIKLTRPSLHYLCQLCSLFFTYGPRLSNFDEAAANLTSLSPSSVIQIIPQLMVQFEHENERVRQVVYNIVRQFAEQHFQALAMPLCLVKRTPNSSKVLIDFIAQMGHEHPEIMHDAEIFTDGMLQIAVTAVEEVIVLLDKALGMADSDEFDEESMAIYRKIYNIVLGQHKSFVKNIFSDQKMRNYTNRLSSIFKPNAMSPTSTANCHLINATASIKQYLQMKMETTPTIDIAELELPLCSASPFSLAVPGCYDVDQAPATIISVDHVMKLIPSAKRPRKLRLVGSDGRCYKYLLKGREDLRLDQRVMQLFSLTNSILHADKFGEEKYLHIRQVPIIPLASNAGLIAWAEGGETIYSMISWHRRIMGIETNEEQVHLINYIGDPSLNSGDKEMTLRLNQVQKLELHRELCQLALDDDIRETLWLRSPCAETWLGQTTNFARSNGLMSIICYIMGIGDRHPSNILVMKQTGNVVHIDFSDCFEKASLRPYVHETVPFRLTRMLVKALGASGIHGVFSMTAEYVMELLRRNKDTLLAFLDIFVQDPITDTLWYRNADDIFPDQDEEPDSKGGSMFKRAIGRVNDKLNGRDFNTPEPLTVKEQVANLIEIATDDMNLAQMYYGWAPFW